MPFDRQARLAFIIACVALAASGLGFHWAVGQLNVFLAKKPVELRETLSNIPRAIGEWKKAGEDARLDEAVLETLGTTSYLSRPYALEPSDGRVPCVLDLHLAYYTGFIDAVPHVPDRCAEAGGLVALTRPQYHDLVVDRSSWREDPVHRFTEDEPYWTMVSLHRIKGNAQTLRMPAGDFRLRVTEFQNPEHPELRYFIGYLFIANGWTTASPEGVKALAFDPTDEFAYYTKVQFSIVGDSTLDVSTYLQYVTDFMNPLLPELMRCLPDWAEVQSEQATGAEES